MTGNTTVLVTGAGGFVGAALCRRLVEAGNRVRGTGRSQPANPVPGVEYRVNAAIDRSTDWRSALEGVDAVVHAAARVHILAEREADPLAAYREVNSQGTENLARQSAAAGVRRFVFLSSIAAQRAQQRIAEGKPASPYGQSKWDAEGALARVAEETGLEVVTLRPPMVYGPGAPGQFDRLLRALRLGLPLPIASIDNRRSLLHIGNLVDAIELALTHPAAPGGVFALSDGAPVSTPELVRQVAAALGRPARLWPCPVALLRLAGRLTGRTATMESLTGSLVVDDREIRQRLGWRPRLDLAAGSRFENEG